MPTEQKLKTTSRAFSTKQVAAALDAAAPDVAATGIKWNEATVTTGGGVAETITQLRRARGKNKNPTKEQVAIRFDPEVLSAFRASGPGWQTRMNSALKEWLHKQPAIKRRAAPKTGG